MPLTSTPRFLNGSKTIPGSFSTSLRRQPPGSTPSRASLRNSPKSASSAACSAPSRNSKMPKLQRQVTSFIQATVGGGLQNLLSYLEERVELALYEGGGTFQLREYAGALPGHRRICEGLIDERVKL